MTFVTNDKSETCDNAICSDSSTRFVASLVQWQRYRTFFRMWHSESVCFLGTVKCLTNNDALKTALCCCYKCACVFFYDAFSQTHSNMDYEMFNVHTTFEKYNNLIIMKCIWRSRNTWHCLGLLKVFSPTHKMWVWIRAKSYECFRAVYKNTDDEWAAFKSNTC